MANPDGYPFNDGVTLGTEGSESGTIIRDQEHPFGARLTLEHEAHTAPFAIACGVYGWMAHTRFFAAEAEANAEFDRMKMALADLLATVLKENGSPESFVDRISAFVAAFP